MKKMKLEATDKTAMPQQRPHIKKGYYVARLSEIKPKKNEGKYGKKIVFVFEILEDKYVIDNKYQQLAIEAYSEYKQQDGTYHTAVTPNSAITKIFMALGWKFNVNGIDTAELIGKYAEVLVKDYTYKFTDQKTNKTEELMASTISEVAPWKESTVNATEETISSNEEDM